MKYPPDIEYFNTDRNEWCVFGDWYLKRNADYKLACKSFEEEVVEPAGLNVFSYDYDWLVARMNKTSKFNFRVGAQN
jgi:hypothetical protein